MGIHQKKWWPYNGGLRNASFRGLAGSWNAKESAPWSGHLGAGLARAAPDDVGVYDTVLAATATNRSSRWKRLFVTSS
jgi:hypothetical protein